MGDSIYRKESLDRMSSPDELTNTIKVIKPSVWVLLIALILVLAGFLVWSVFGRINSTVETVVVSDGESISCLISEKDILSVQPGMTLILEDKEYRLGEQVDDPKSAYYDLDPILYHFGNYGQDEYVYTFSVDGDIDRGIYKAKIVVERVRPITFLWN